MPNRVKDLSRLKLQRSGTMTQYSVFDVTLTLYIMLCLLKDGVAIHHSIQQLITPHSPRDSGHPYMLYLAHPCALKLS